MTKLSEQVREAMNFTPFQISGLPHDFERALAILFVTLPQLLAEHEAMERAIEKVREMDVDNDDTGFSELKIVASMQNTRWRTQRDTILAKLEKQLSK